MGANLEFVRSIYAAHERGDYGSAEWAHPDIEYVVVGGLTPGRWNGRAAMASAARELFSAWEEHPDATVHRGPAALVARMSEIDNVWEELRVEPQEFIDTDEFVVVPIRALVRGRGSGVGVEFDEVHVYRLRDGKIIELREYREKAEALKAVGLEE